MGIRGGTVLSSTADLSGGCVRDPMGTSPGSGRALGVVIIIHSIIKCLLLAAAALPLSPPAPGDSQVSVPIPMQ